MAITNSGTVRKSATGPKYGGGSRKGIPNKATQTAREAFAQLIEGNAPMMNEWLTQVANGIPVMENILQDDGTTVKQQAERNGVPLWIVPPSPEKALDIMQKMAEYNIPKLARTELVGDADKPVLHLYKWQDD